MTKFKGGEGPTKDLPETNTNLTNNNVVADHNICDATYKKIAVKDILKWANNNDIILIPCQNATKKPFVEISEPVLKTEGVFHIPTPMRVNIVKNIWHTINEVLENKGGINIALDTNVGWNNGKHLSFIDIDNKHYMNTFIQAFSTCPIVFGKNGCKIIFFLENQPKTSFALLLNDKEESIGEFYSSGTDRLCFIYGKHPKTLENPDNPIYYNFDIKTGKVPVFGNEFTDMFNECLIKENLKFYKHNTQNTDNTNKIHLKPTFNKNHQNSRTITEYLGLNMSRLVASGQNDNNMIITSNPFPGHSNSSGTSLHVDINKNSWYCHQHHTGGGPAEFIAIERGLIDCADCYKGNNALTGQTFKKFCGTLIKHGEMTDEQYRKWRGY